MIVTSGGQQHHIVLRDGWDRNMGNERMNRAVVDLAGAEQDFVEFFAVLESGVDDVDRLARLVDHLVGHVDYLHRVAHVEHECFAVAADCGRLDDKLHGFVNGHEETRDFGVSDRDGAAGLDL